VLQDVQTTGRLDPTRQRALAATLRAQGVTPQQLAGAPKPPASWQETLQKDGWGNTVNDGTLNWAGNAGLFNKDDQGVVWQSIGPESLLAGGNDPMGRLLQNAGLKDKFSNIEWDYSNPDQPVPRGDTSGLSGYKVSTLKKDNNYIAIIKDKDGKVLSHESWADENPSVGRQILNGAAFVGAGALGINALFAPQAVGAAAGATGAAGSSGAAATTSALDSALAAARTGAISNSFLTAAQGGDFNAILRNALTGAVTGGAGGAAAGAFGATGATGAAVSGGVSSGVSTAIRGGDLNTVLRNAIIGGASSGAGAAAGGALRGTSFAGLAPAAQSVVSNLTRAGLGRLPVNTRQMLLQALMATSRQPANTPRKP
jgi:hypothetical protein